MGPCSHTPRRTLLYRRILCSFADYRGLQYFINGFAPVISVLGKPERNKLLKTLLPAASTSPILLHALIGWAASHVAVAQPNRGDGKNEPYTSIARITTSIADHTALVKMNSVGMQGAQEGDLSLENEMWLLLILGGIEVSFSIDSHDGSRS